MKQVYTITSETQLLTLAEALLKFADDARVFLLYGEIGAGKTTFTKQICKKLNVSDNVNSPTFAIINEYLNQYSKVFHIDLYRLKNIDEAIDIGIEDILYSGAYCFVEWAELIEPLLPANVVSVQFEMGEDGEERIVTFEK